MLRRRFTYSNVVATLALVFAMSGGALAASKFLITSTKQIKPSVLASLKGKAGKAGANGAPGPAGPAGPAGGVGPAGPAGTPGAPGEPGPEGKEGKAGKNGTNGKEGSPWTVGGTLPAGSTETGTWSVGPTPENTYEPISFTIPLAHALTRGHAHFINSAGKEEPTPGTEVESTTCLGSAAEPKATSGNLCVYEAELNVGFTGSVGIRPVANSEGESAGTTGALVLFATTKGSFSGSGSWAVTG